MLKRIIKREGQDTILILQVKTRQKVNRLIFKDDCAVIFIKDPPIKGKANKTILKVLRKYFNTEISLESGHTSNHKVFRLQNLIPEQVQIIIEFKKKKLE